MNLRKSLTWIYRLTFSFLLLVGVGLIYSCGRNNSMATMPDPIAQPAATGSIGVSSRFGDPPVVNQAQTVSLTLLWE